MKRAECYHCDGRGAWLTMLNDRPIGYLQCPACKGRGWTLVPTLWDRIVAWVRGVTP